MKITVLMSVHNGEKYLKEAIESILNQTFKDFEFLIVNDGSTDSSKEIIFSYNDPRIVYVENETNIGLTKSLNKGLKLAKGEYIARMDADDISLPERLEEQVEFMDQHPDIGICGARLRLIGGGRNWKMPSESDLIKASMIFFNPLFHPTVIIRKKILDDNNLKYDESFRYAQDYELWSRIKNFTDFHNIQKSLVLYRISGDRITKKSSGQQKSNAAKVSERLVDELGISLSEEEKLLQSQIFEKKIERTKNSFKRVEEWLLKLKAHNDKNGIYEKKIFDKALSDYWLLVCGLWAKLGFWTLHQCRKSSLYLKDGASKEKKIKLFIRCLARHEL